MGTGLDADKFLLRREGVESMKNKYHAEKETVGNEKFHSRKEARRYKELLLMERAGVISGLKRQVRYLLIPTQYDEDGKRLEYSVNYYADFVYYSNGKLIVEDCKGVRTDAYIIKRKLMLSVYGIRIFET